jgi:hypothetical protein
MNELFELYKENLFRFGRIKDITYLCETNRENKVSQARRDETPL